MQHVAPLGRVTLFGLLSSNSKLVQELSYLRTGYRYMDICMDVGTDSCVSCAHNASRASNPVTLKSRLRVTQGHWQRNHWIDHTGLLLIELFDVAYHRDLEMWVRGHSVSLKIVLFDGPYTTFYRSAIVTIALSCTVFELFDGIWYRDLEIWVRSHSRYPNWYHSKAWVRFPIRLP